MERCGTGHLQRRRLQGQSLPFRTSDHRIVGTLLFQYFYRGLGRTWAAAAIFHTPLNDLAQRVSFEHYLPMLQVRLTCSSTQVRTLNVTLYTALFMFETTSLSYSR